MNIYLLEQDLNNCYDTYDSCVVAAINEIAARNTHPKGGEYEQSSNDWVPYAEIDRITVKLIGVANEDVSAGVICASFNAG